MININDDDDKDIIISKYLKLTDDIFNIYIYTYMNHNHNSIII